MPTQSCLQSSPSSRQLRTHICLNSSTLPRPLLPELETGQQARRLTLEHRRMCE